MGSTAIQNLEFDQRGLLQHICALQVINNEIGALQTAGMRQPKITGFFSLKAPVCAVLVDQSGDDLPSIDGHNAANSSLSSSEVSGMFLD